MKNLYRTIAFSFLIFCFLHSMADGRKSCIDEGWKFHYGAVNASAVDYDDSGWRILNLPHDWSVETDAAAATGEHVGPFAKNNVGGSAVGQTVGGEGWYRKAFTLSSDDADKQISLYFEGVYNHAEVWLNGRKLYFNHYGYVPFRFDITPFLNQLGTENILAVRVTNEGKNTRWYAGSGIYRHVWLIKTPHLYADQWDTYIQATNVGKTSATIQASSIIHNNTHKSVNARVEISLRDPQGREVATTQKMLTLAISDSSPVSFTFSVDKPSLWSPDTPSRYQAIIKCVDRDNGSIDEQKISFGIRSLAFSADKGFLLNDSSVFLRGGCVHHDNGLLGAAAYNRAEDRKLQLLKDQGFNAVRCSHNMPSDHFLDACDSLGLMVIDEAFDQWLVAKNSDDYHNYFNEFSDRDLQTMVRRDRNHPSIIMWSIGNEIPGRIESDGIKAAERLRQTVRQYDVTRPVTAAICSWNQPSRSWDDEDNLAFRSLDVGGYNYLYGKYVHDHVTHPDRVMFGSESYPKYASQNWDLVEKYPYVIGDFVWTAMDYLGEAGIGSASIRNKGNQPMFQGWPWYNGWCGDIDLIGQKKPQSYYRDVVWHRAPITMAVEEYIPAGYYQSISAWGWQLEHQDWYNSTEGQLLRVNVYSRSSKVKLYLNEQLLGEKTPGNTYWAGFDVPYKKGVLKAVTAEGEVFVLKTPGEPVALRLTVDRNNLDATGCDLSYVTIELVDADGNVVPDSKRMIDLSVTGAGTLLAAGNASPIDQGSFRSTTPCLYRGRALAILLGGKQSGNIVLCAKSSGLQAQTAEIKVSAPVVTGLNAYSNAINSGKNLIYGLNGLALSSSAQHSGIVIYKKGKITKKVLNK
jgi:beta-galactosidase